jgi:hypothetical protein
MSTSARKSACLEIQQGLPAYLDYMLEGKHFMQTEQIEKHLVCCFDCATEYADLLAMKLETLLEQWSEKCQVGKRPPDRADFNTYFNEHLEEFCRDWDYWPGITQAMILQARFWEIEGDLQQAESSFLEALHYCEENNYLRYQSLAALGKLADCKEDRNAALLYRKMARQAAEEYGDSYILAAALVELGEEFCCYKDRFICSAFLCFKRAVDLGCQNGFAAAMGTASARLLELQEQIESTIRKVTKKELSHLFPPNVLLIDERLFLLERNLPALFIEAIVDEGATGEARQALDLVNVEMHSVHIAPAVLNAFLEKQDQWDLIKKRSAEESASCLIERLKEKLQLQLSSTGLFKEEAETAMLKLIENIALNLFSGQASKEKEA